MEPLYTVAEVAAVLGTSQDFVRAHYRQMDARRLGTTRLIRIPASGIEKFARSIGRVVLFPPLPGAQERFITAREIRSASIKARVLSGGPGL